MIKRILCLLLGAVMFVAVAMVAFSLLRAELPKPSVEGQFYTRPAIAETEATQEETIPETQAETQPPETMETEPTQPETTAPPETEPAYQRHYYDQVPLYDQSRYESIRYGKGTVATSGSNIAALAMAASYLTGEEYLPEELAKWFADFIGNPMQWVEHVSDQLQLPWKKAENIDVTLQALKEGKIAVVVMKERSIFRESQHFVVFTGLSEEGKILINDPYGPNYDAWNLKNALVSGFSRGDVSGGYAGAWIYDPAQVGERPFVYEPEWNDQPFRYPGLEVSEEDKTLLAKLVWVEAASEPFEGQQAVAEVILNRLYSDQFPSTMNGVIYAEGQFLASANIYLAELTHTQYEAVERALNGPYVLPGDVYFFSQWAVNDNVWGTIGQHTFCYGW